MNFVIFHVINENTNERILDKERILNKNLEWYMAPSNTKLLPDLVANSVGA